MSTLDTLGTVAGLASMAGGFGLLYWRWTSDRKKLVQSSPVSGSGSTSATKTSGPVKAGPHGAVAPVPGAVSPLAIRAGSQIPILGAAELFQRTGTLGQIELIRTRLSYAPDNFQSDVAPLLSNVAEFVQLLPASESHHHAQPGGLIIHLMDVAANALTLREAYKLPQGGSPEDQIRLGPVWSYAVLVGALLHDIGKPVADILVQLYGADVTKPLVQWSGLAGSMVAAVAAAEGASSSLRPSHYSVAFPTAAQRDYSAHQRLPIALLHAMVPAATLQWLLADAQIRLELTACLEGADPPAGRTSLHDIVSKADSMSVAKNLATGSRVRFSSARQVPMIERLMAGLRTLLAEGLVALNRPGAGAFVDPDGVHLWMVAGVAANETRKILEQREDKSTGAEPAGISAGIPSDNTRLFDTWAEYGALVQPSAEFGKGSVWWVRFSTQDGEWEQILTCLKFPLDKLYVAGQVRPAPFNGVIVPVDPKLAQKTKSTGPVLAPAEQSVAGPGLDAPGVAATDAGAGVNAEGDAAQQQTAPVERLEYQLESYSQNDQDAHPVATDTTGVDSSDFLAQMMAIGEPHQALTVPAADQAPAKPKEPAQASPAATAATPTDVLASRKSATAKAHPGAAEAALAPPQPDAAEDGFLDEEETVAAATAAKRSPTGAVQAMPKNMVGPKPAFSREGKPRPNADKFMAWVQQGLANGELSYNESDALIHFVDDGMLLITPKIFRVYLETHEYDGSIGASKDALRALQLDVQRAGYLAVNAAEKANFHHWRVKQADGTVSNSIITTYLIPNPQAYIRPVPAPNTLLVRDLEAHKAQQARRASKTTNQSAEQTAALALRRPKI